MKWLKENQDVVLLIVVFTVFAVIYIVKSPKDITYTKIIIENGDSLWVLSEQYRGEMNHDDWIQLVMVENNMPNAKITAGNELIIPITQNATKYTSEKFGIAREVR